MTHHTILMSNLGYLRGIDGRLSQHVRYAHRHFYSSKAAQMKSLRALVTIIEEKSPDLCCFVEIDQASGGFNQFLQLKQLLAGYEHSDIENKYGQGSHLRRFPLTKGKSNAFLARKDYPHEKVYFTHGTKRLIYKLALDAHITVFFAHFSLKKAVRMQQLLQVRQLLEQTPGEVILLGDFNILTGTQELAPLLRGSSLHLLNREEDPTFTFHRSQKLLDLCIYSDGLKNRIGLEVVEQSFSDHAALLVEVK